MQFPFPLLQRYIFREIVRMFVLVLSVITTLVVFVGVFQRATESGLGLMTLLEILPYIVSSMLPFTIPAALLLTVVVVYGRIAGDQEITAAKAAGINVMTLMTPAFVMGGLMSVFSLLLTDQVIPYAENKIQQTIVMAVEDVFLERLRTDGRYVDNASGISINASVKGRKLINPVIRKSSRRKEPMTVMARSAELKFDLRRQLVRVLLDHATVLLPHDQQIEDQRKYELTFRLPNSDGPTKPRQLSIEEIHVELESANEVQEAALERRDAEIAIAITRGDFRKLADVKLQRPPAVAESRTRVNRLSTEMHSRYALACSCFFFVFLGTPFAIFMAKSQVLTSFLFCFGPIVGVYYPLVLGIMAQCRQGRMDPAWAVWIGNTLLTGVAVQVIRRVLKH